MQRPFCSVLLPSGKKALSAKAEVDFDTLYRTVIAPASEEAGLDPFRVNSDTASDTIHKSTYEHFLLCEYAVVDLTTANANVFYLIGLRAATRPRSTVLLFAKDGQQLPFDENGLQIFSYALNQEGKLTNVEAVKTTLAQALIDTQKAVAEGAKTENPALQLIEGPPPNIAHAKTDIFRAQVRYSVEKKAALAAAREQGVAAVRSCEQQLGLLADVEAGVIIDLLLSYRAVQAWEEMVALVKKMPGPLASTVMVQEQLALALNRAGYGEEAEKILIALLERHGPSSETCSILGRVYKDRWEEAVKQGKTALVQGLLNKAIAAYLQGFETDWRDAFPGINAITLMELRDPPDPRREQLLPVVTYAVERKIASGTSDYWDYATRLELAVLAKDEQKAKTALSDALTAIRESWEPETTARNLRLIRETREHRQERVPWTAAIEGALLSSKTA